MPAPTLSATVLNFPEHFSVQIPQILKLDKESRDDMQDYFKDFGGQWSATTKRWLFPLDKKVEVEKILGVYNVRPIPMSMKDMETHMRDEKVIIIHPEPVIEKPRPVMVQVPKLITAENPSVIAIIEAQERKLEEMFRKAWEDTGVNKTRMREILSRAVPAMPSLIGPKRV